jgi:hypothetical protein
MNQNLRRRKNHFECQHAQQERNKNLIKRQAASLNAFCRSIGLKINKLILNRNDDLLDENDVEKSIKVLIEKQNYSHEEKAFRFLRAKDVANLSIVKYRLIRKEIMNIESCNIMGIKAISPIKFRIDNYFRLYNNEKGFWVHPQQKILFVCQKFLSKNPDFNRRIFRIKLCCDGVSVSSTKINLINFSFNLLDDAQNKLNIQDTYILGMNLSN